MEKWVVTCDKCGGPCESSLEVRATIPSVWFPWKTHLMFGKTLYLNFCRECTRDLKIWIKK